MQRKESEAPRHRHVRTRTLGSGLPEACQRDDAATAVSASNELFCRKNPKETKKGKQEGKKGEKRTKERKKGEKGRKKGKKGKKERQARKERKERKKTKKGKKQRKERNKGRKGENERASSNIELLPIVLDSHASVKAKHAV